MSRESAVAFLSKVSQDSDLRARVEGAREEGAWLEVAGAAGFDCTFDELREVGAEIASHLVSQGELSDEALDQVAGGIVGPSDIQSFESYNFHLGSLRNMESFGILYW